MGTMTTSYTQDAFEGIPFNKLKEATEGLTFSLANLYPRVHTRVYQRAPLTCVAIGDAYIDNSGSGAQSALAP